MNIQNENQEVLNRINYLTTKITSAPELSKHLRRFSNYSIKLALTTDEDIDKVVLAEGIYWINELAEMLDPYLESTEEIEKCISDSK